MRYFILLGFMFLISCENSKRNENENENVDNTKSAFCIKLLDFYNCQVKAKSVYQFCQPKNSDFLSAYISAENMNKEEANMFLSYYGNNLDQKHNFINKEYGCDPSINFNIFNGNYQDL